MQNPRPLVFIGSSAEGLRVAKAVQVELEHSAECVIWSQGVFGLSEGTLESLVKWLPRCDFAILVLTPDDLVASRGTHQPAPRDNVLLELGMFIGGLSLERTFMLVDKSAQVKLPTDVAGLTPATYQPPQGGNWQSAVGPACTRIEEVIRDLGSREYLASGDSPCPVAVSGSMFVDVSLGRGIRLTIKNVSAVELLPYSVVLFHPTIGKWEVFSSEKSGRLLPEQVRVHNCVLEPRSGTTPFFVGVFREGEMAEKDISEFVFRLVLEDSDKVLYEQAEFGAVLARLICSLREKEQGCRDSVDWSEFFHFIHRTWPTASDGIDSPEEEPDFVESLDGLSGTEIYWLAKAVLIEKAQTLTGCGWADPTAATLVSKGLLTPVEIANRPPKSSIPHTIPSKVWSYLNQHKRWLLDQTLAKNQDRSERLEELRKVVLEEHTEIAERVMGEDHDVLRKLAE